jgi:hypothetical protein
MGMCEHFHPILEFEGEHNPLIAQKNFSQIDIREPSPFDAELASHQLSNQKRISTNR